ILEAAMIAALERVGPQFVELLAAASGESRTEIQCDAPRELLTVSAAAKRYAIPPGTFYAWLSRRQIPHIRLGPRMVRFDAVGLEKWINGKRVEPEDKGVPAAPSNATTNGSERPRTREPRGDPRSRQTR